MRETWHEHYLRLCLPGDMWKSFSASLSIKTFLGLIQSKLETIYGQRANWEKNIEKYFQSKDYVSQCLVVHSVEEIPEITFEDIQKWISEEKDFSTKINRLITLLPHFDDKDQVGSAIEEAASILGLLGPEHSAVYHWIIDWDNISDGEIKAIQENIINHPHDFIIAIRTLIKLCFNGRLVTYPILETVMTQQKQRYFYRGENAYYGSSKPGSYRNVDDGDSNRLAHQINDLRMNEGCEFLDKFLATFAWSYSTTNHYALCQHYGLKTEMLDVTSDIWAALFFSTCCFDKEEWRPLRKEEIDNKDSRSDISSRGGDSRYGIIYRRLEEPDELWWPYQKEDILWDIIFPIGYQPYMRCAYQHAYGLFECDDKYDMYKDRKFAKYKIRLTEDLCQWVFEHTHHGKDIFPNDDIPDISSYMRKINETHKFSRESFTSIMEGQKISAAAQKSLERELNDHGYYIDRGDVSFITDEEVAKINSAYPPERAKKLTTGLPVSDPIYIEATSGQAARDREADDEKYKFMIINPNDRL